MQSQRRAKRYQQLREICNKNKLSKDELNDLGKELRGIIREVKSGLIRNSNTENSKENTEQDWNNNKDTER